MRHTEPAQRTTVGSPRRSVGIRTTAVVACLVVAGCVSRDASPGRPPPPILFEGARIVIGDGTAIERGALLVQGGRILDVGGSGEVDAPPGTLRENLSGRTVIPALIDAHAHLGYEGYDGWGAGFYSRENLVDHLDRYAYYGFGAVFSAGSDPSDLALEVQRAQESGDLRGEGEPTARFLFGAGLGPPGAGPNDLFLAETDALADRIGTAVVRGAGTPGEGRAAVAEVAATGIRFVKIWVDDRGGSQPKMPPEVYHAIIDEAHGRGLDVLVHQQSAVDMPDLIDAGADGFLHGRFNAEFDRDLAERLAAADVFVVPNLGLGELRLEPIGEDPFLNDAVAPEVAARLSSRPGATPGPESRERELAAAFRRVLDAGVPVVLGTDAGAIPDHPFGYTGHRELEIFVRLGMSPMDALVSATGAAAEALGLRDAGLLEPGRSADFVVLRENPLDDIRNTRSIEAVYLRGEPVDRESSRLRWTAGS